MDLVHRRSDLSESGIEPVIISFSEVALVQRWIEESDCPFDVFIDHPRRLYATFGLPRTLAATMNCSTMRYYGEKMANKTKLPNMEAQEDTIQLGGNFTVDCQSEKLVFYYPSKSPTDRPTVDMILSGNRK